jgi:uncharacterized membrane protein YfcA
VIQRKISAFVPVGLLGVMAGIFLHYYTHEHYSDFVSGFLMGVSIVLLIFGVAQQMKSMPK